MTLLLEPMAARLGRQRDLRSTLDQAVRDVVALHGGEFGDIQLCVPDGSLVLVGHAGLTRAFLESFARVASDDYTVCARALRAKSPVSVEDVAEDPQFAPYLERIRSAPFRSVLSAPLITSRDRAVGVVSAHFAHPYRPTTVEMRSLTEYCRLLADRIEEFLGAGDVDAIATRLSREMLASAE